MLAKKNRLTKRTDFSAIYSKGAYVRQGDIMIKYIQTDNPEARIGFSLGKSFSKKAVERNRARRILQEACRTHIQSLKPGFDIVVMPAPQAKEIKFENSVRTLQQIFKKANLFV